MTARSTENSDTRPVPCGVICVRFVYIWDSVRYGLWNDIWNDRNDKENSGVRLWSSATVCNPYAACTGRSTTRSPDTHSPKHQKGKTKTKSVRPQREQRAWEDAQHVIK